MISESMDIIKLNPFPTGVPVDEGLGWSERKCEWCGNTIRIPDLRAWTFKRMYVRGNAKHKYFCGWSCMRNWDQTPQGQQKAKEGGKSHGTKADIVKADVLEEMYWDRHLSITAMKRELGVSYSTVEKYMEIYDIYGDEHRKGRERPSKKERQH